ncbi:MAG: putative sugar nucleotidyl transferase [Candidatus Neomarinimicrobiota bacterium]
MNLYIYENQQARDLEPLSLTRPAFDLKPGTLSFLDRILEQFPAEKICLFVRPELEEICRELRPEAEINPARVEQGLWLLGNVFWSREDLVLMQTGPLSQYYSKGTMIGAKLSKDQGRAWLKSGGPVKIDPDMENSAKDLESPYCRYLWNILDLIPDALELEKPKIQNNPREYVNGEISILEPDNVFISDTAEIQPNVVINGRPGPVIIGDGVCLKAHSYLEGPLSLGQKTLIKPFTQIKNSVIGTGCKLGGELNTVIIQGYSNKVHDGFLGNSYLGEWVNLGAGTHTSNLKNNYADIIVQVNGRAVDTEQLLAGSFIGDHVKTAIGTVLNSGTVIGPGCLIAAAGFPSKTLRPFTWYVNHRHKAMIWEKFMTTAEIVESRRGRKISSAERLLLKRIFEER